MTWWQRAELKPLVYGQVSTDEYGWFAWRRNGKRGERCRERVRGGGVHFLGHTSITDTQWCFRVDVCLWPSQGCVKFSSGSMCLPYGNVFLWESGIRAVLLVWESAVTKWRLEYNMSAAIPCVVEPEKTQALLIAPLLLCLCASARCVPVRSKCLRDTIQLFPLVGIWKVSLSTSIVQKQWCVVASWELPSVGRPISTWSCLNVINIHTGGNLHLLGPRVLLSIHTANIQLSNYCCSRDTTPLVLNPLWPFNDPRDIFFPITRHFRWKCFHFTNEPSG